MRLITILVPLLASLHLAGCTSTSAIDVLNVPAPSAETTSSVRPSEPVGVAELLAEDPQEPAPEKPDAQSTASKIAEPIVAAVALVTPGLPSAKSLEAIDDAVRRYGFRDAKPINFGTASPRKLAVHGVDVSRWQGDIDWAKLRAQGANFVYIKATDGGDHLDPMFRKNWREASQAGLKRGAYHFFYWCRTAGEQADWFIRNVPRERGALPPVIDVEYNGESRCKQRLPRTRVLEKMQVFMDKLEAHYGQRPVIYTAPDFYRDNLKGEFLNYPFWLRAVAQHPSKVYPGRKWLFWQYSGSGLSHGVKGKIDLNVFNGGEREWRAWTVGQSVVADGR